MVAKMGAYGFLHLLVVISWAASAAAHPGPGAKCRNIPGDAAWPSRKEWQQLNATVQGRLIATNPLGRVCHHTGSFSGYDEDACQALKTNWVQSGPSTLQPHPGEIMNPYFQNLSCSPFTPADQPCVLGARAVYSIDVRKPSDVQAGLRFAHEKNVRLVIKSTGIDYMGKSTGQGSLALWLWNLKTTEIIPHYQSRWYTGAAIKLGPGVIAGEAYAAAAAAGYRFVGPECGLVGVAGGYAQGGGHSQLSTAYGLAADQVLEWEVVTPSGKHLVATPEKNTDLYWALSGGGGGTFGVVLSMTAKAYPESPVAGGLLVFQNTNDTAYWEAIEAWFRQTPAFVANTTNNVQFAFTRDMFLGFSLTLPGQDVAAVDALLAPFKGTLDRLRIPYNVSAAQSASYAEHYVASYGPLPYGQLCPTYVSLASRLVPRATVRDAAATARLTAAYRAILAADGDFSVGCSVLDVAHVPPHPPNAVLPAWRDAIAYCNPQSAWRFEDPAASVAAKEALAARHFPALEAATPGSGVYLNEIDPLYQGDWKESMYGVNYDRLLKIKRKNDPHDLMYALFAVGSEDFFTDKAGRLCCARAK